MSRKQQKLTGKELRRKHTNWFKNFSKGIDEILNLSESKQKYLWYLVLNECLYTTESNPFLLQMYKNDGFYDLENPEGLEDVCLVPMNRARLIEGMKSLLMNGGKKKWTDTLKTINESADRENY
jgi:hypothetical protein